MILEKDFELIPWVYGVLEQGAGGFLTSMAEAATRADQDNYPILRPVLLQLKAKYPDYHSTHSVEQADGISH